MLTVDKLALGYATEAELLLCPSTRPARVNDYANGERPRPRRAIPVIIIS